MTGLTTRYLNLKITRRKTMKCPDNLTREDVWRLLGEYAHGVGDYEGVLLTDDPYVKEAWDQYCESKRIVGTH
tara:strand:- start:8614 stop:8832 length:219 start_codon:yes stop_codon:yes gene_type:complete